MKIFQNAVASIAVLLSVQLTIAETTSQKLMSVDADKINGRLTINGRLGPPLGTTVSIKGTVKIPDDDSIPSVGPLPKGCVVVEIMEVNGKHPGRKVFMRIEANEGNKVAHKKLVTAKNGDLLSFSGYETGGFYGMTSDEYSGLESPDVPFGFYTFFYVPPYLSSSEKRKE